MNEKDKRILKYAIDNLIARENNLCEGFCKAIIIADSSECSIR